MYSEWSSLVDEIRGEISLDNVLSAYPAHAGKEVVSIVLKSLTDTPHSRDLPISLLTHSQVKWTMDVISHGLTLPLSEHKLMHLCIDMYESWLSALHEPKKSVPKTVKDAPDAYIQIIFKQLTQVFTPRAETSTQGSVGLSNSSIQLLLDNQGVLCKRILSIFHHAVMDTQAKMTRESWDCLLLCLLRINDIVLTPPLEPNTVAANLKALPIQVLFEAWLRASTSWFPRPQLWKSLHELCGQWRHHGSLANQWTRLVYTLTYHVICNLYTKSFMGDVQPSPDANFGRLVQMMPHDVLVQCWYRVLHMLGNPVELSYPHIIAKLPAFQKHLSDSLQHQQQQQQRSSKHHLHVTAQPYLASLPRIYYELMRGVATLVYLFLGQEISWTDWEEDVAGSYLGEQLKRHDSNSYKSSQGQERYMVWYIGGPGAGLGVGLR